MIGGLPVTEVAPYAFSGHMDEQMIDKGLESGKFSLYVPELFRGEERPPALCGAQLEEILFPKSLRRVGRYCFYNCGQLRRISFYGELSDWGSGVFTGCHRVSELQVHTDVDGKSRLKDVLDELPEALQVEYFIYNVSDKESGANYTYTRLTFPEFFEEGVENTPARILETHVHGSGIFYRNCFKNRIFDFAQYDLLFPYAVAQEAPRIVAQMAMNRLRFPCGLTGRAQQQYQEYAWENGRLLADMLLEASDLPGICWLLDTMEQKDLSGELLSYMTEQASRHQQAEIMSCLVEYRRTHMRSGRTGRRRLTL